MTPKRFKTDIGVGPTNEFSLRVSVATLVRVIFENPGSSDWMLALERKATLLFAPAAVSTQRGLRRDPSDVLRKHFVDVKAQPFGGAIQIHDLRMLQDHIGDFHFDSRKSRSEQDFRLFIQPAAWNTVQQFCLQHFIQDDLILEADPRRELAEEFADLLQIHLRAEQYTYQPVGTIIEDLPSPTENTYARGSLTARIYRIFEARIVDSSLRDALMANSEGCSDHDLQKRALQNSQNGGPGWANAALTLPLKQIITGYLAISPQARNQPTSFQTHQLDETVAAVLENVTVPKYRRLLTEH